MNRRGFLKLLGVVALAPLGAAKLVGSLLKRPKGSIDLNEPPKWKNHTAQYTKITKDDAELAMRRCLANFERNWMGPTTIDNAGIPYWVQGPKT